MNSELAYRIALVVLVVLMRLVRLPVLPHLGWRRSWPLLRRDPLDTAYLFSWALAAIAVLVAFIAFPATVRWAALPLPPALRWSGAAVSLAALALLRWADAALGENLSVSPQLRPNHQLVTTGPYRWIRHPMYLSGLLYCAGLGIVTANGLAAAFLVGGMLLLVQMRIPKEERLLEERFGDSYRQWAGRTGKLLPRLGRQPA